MPADTVVGAAGHDHITAFARTVGVAGEFPTMQAVLAMAI